MPIGAKKRVLYQVTPVYAAKRNVKFSSSNSKVVSVNAKGYAERQSKNGKATITVQLKAEVKESETESRCPASGSVSFGRQR